MSTTESKCILTYVDDNGNQTLLYPATTTSSISPDGDLPMDGNLVTGLGDPVEDTDAANKGFVKKYADERFPYVADSTYPQCFKRTVDGVTEWLNPPFVIGTEYRTSERFYGGKILHAKHTTTKVGSSFTDSNINSFARVTARCGSKVLPYYEDGELKIWLEISGNTISPKSVSGYGGQVVDLLMYYIKAS